MSEVTIPSESNLRIVIEFTRTSLAFTPEERLAALRDLLQRCTAACITCQQVHALAARTILESRAYRAKLDAMGGLAEGTHRIFAGMTDSMLARSTAELADIGRNLVALQECRRLAELGVAEATRFF